MYILVLLGTFIIMEAVTWLTHRFVMHGLLWYLHRDHHQKEPGFFEKNDWFFVIFAIPSMLLIGFGTYNEIWWMQAIGFGIMAYGAAYFLVHDVIIHQRFKWFSRSKSTYVRAYDGLIKCITSILINTMVRALECCTCIRNIGKR
jgi:beta-carotene 3-hydroxylase